MQDHVQNVKICSKSSPVSMIRPSSVAGLGEELFHYTRDMPVSVLHLTIKMSSVLADIIMCWMYMAHVPAH